MVAMKFEYGMTRVRDLQISAVRDAEKNKVRVTGMTVAGRPVTPTKRFWSSFFHRFGMADNVFRYFDHAEVFARIAERAKDDAVRYCLETDAKGSSRLLAVANPGRGILEYGELEALLGRHGADEVEYADGVVTSRHVPRSGEAPFSIMGDRFAQRFTLDTPIDGFSLPKIHLSLLRQVCSNGMVAYGPAFRSELSVGKDPLHNLERALESFDNGDGYSALRQRFEAAQRSWASVNECNQMRKQLGRLGAGGEVGRVSLLADFTRMTGNLAETYGLASLDSLPLKRQRLLPARCRVYDLINFATEVATHHATTYGGRSLQAVVGTLVSDEYDMEGTADHAAEFADFFTAGGRPGELN